MESYTDKFFAIEPLLSSYLFGDTVSRMRHYWDSLKDFKLYENLEIISDNDSMAIAVPSLYNDRFTKLELSRSGQCARVTYTPEFGGAILNLFINSENKVKAITAYNNETHQPLLDLFYGSDFARFFNVVIPKDEISEVLFQYSTVSNTNLSFIEEFL